MSTVSFKLFDERVIGVKRRAVALVVVVALVVSLIAAGCGQKPQSNAGSADKAAPADKADKKVVFKLGHVVQVADPWNKSAEHFRDLVEQRTNGRIKIEIYPARQLGGDRDMFEMIQNGSLEMGLISTAPIGAFTPVLNGLQLPWLVPNWDVMEKALTSDAARKLLKALEGVKVEGLAFYESGFRHFATTKKFINTPDDLKGLKYRVVESPMMLDTFKALKTNTVTMPYGEIYTGLQTGVIEAIDMGPSAFYNEKQFEVAKYYTFSYIYGFPAALIINLDKFKALSPEDQKIMRDSAWETVRFNMDYLQKSDQEKLELLKKAGVKVSTLTPEQMKPFREVVKPVWDKYMKTDPLVEEYVKEVQKIAAAK